MRLSVLALSVLALGPARADDEQKPVEMTPDQIREHVAKSYAAILMRDQAIADLMEQVEARDKMIERLKGFARACRS